MSDGISQPYQLDESISNLSEGSVFPDCLEVATAVVVSVWVGKTLPVH